MFSFLRLLLLQLLSLAASREREIGKWNLWCDVIVVNCFPQRLVVSENCQTSSHHMILFSLPGEMTRAGARRGYAQADRLRHQWLAYRTHRAPIYWIVHCTKSPMCWYARLQSYWNACRVIYASISMQLCICASMHLCLRAPVHPCVCLYKYIWACAKTPLTYFDGKGDHLMRTPTHAQCTPDAYPMHAPMQRSRLRSGHIGARPYV